MRPRTEAGSPWATIAGAKVVLAVARTVTSTVRVLEAVEAFDGDHRVEVVFAVNDTSAFAEGVRQLLCDAGVRPMAWRDALNTHFDAVVTASENTDLAGLSGPVLVLPHGIGFHKYVPDPRDGGRRRLSGTVRPQDLVGRDVLVAVSHPDQVRQLRDQDPDLADRAVVVADPVFERLRGSVWFRERYRAALGTGDRHLVVVSSTWGDQSLLGRWPDLPTRLLSELPLDEFDVVAVLHPNIWSWHGAWQVRRWLAPARDAGLTIVGPEGGWQAALVAADCVVGDHGSVSLYAAGLGRALLLAPFGSEVAPGTSLSRLGQAAPRLDPAGSLTDQVTAAIATHSADLYAEISQSTFAMPPVARSLRSILYEMIGLDEPEYGQPAPGWPEPGGDRTFVRSFAVYTRLASSGQVWVRRIPAAVDAPGRGDDDSWLRHLAVDEDEWDLRLVHSASVFVRSRPASSESAARWAAQALLRLPGTVMAVASTMDGCVAALRGGLRVTVTATPPSAGVMALAACVYTLFRTGSLANRDIIVHMGPSETGLRIEIP